MKNSIAATALRLWRSHKRHFYYTIIGVSAIFVIYIAIYTAYNARFIVDEVYQGKGPREYTIDEKITLRVVAPKDISLLKSFVEHYSLCQSIDRIYVVTSSPITKPGASSPATVEELFTFAHTHCPVVLRNTLDSSKLDTLGNSLDINTQGVLLLDPEVLVSCEDISFLQGVLRSSGSSAVGLYPRLHSIVNSHTIAYHGSSYVWWHSQYSLLLSHAIALPAETWKSLNDASSVSTGLRSLLQHNPHCYNVALSIYTTYKHHSAPIWADVPITTISPMRSSSDKYSECLTLIYNVLEKPQLPTSHFKSKPAKDVLFW